MRCDCINRIYVTNCRNGRGVILSSARRKRYSLSNKQIYNLQDKGLDTVEANHQLGFKEERTYEISEMVNFLGIKN